MKTWLMADLPHHCLARIPPQLLVLARRQWWRRPFCMLVSSHVDVSWPVAGHHDIMQLEIVALYRDEPVAILFQHHRFRLPRYGMDTREIRCAVHALIDGGSHVGATPSLTSVGADPRAAWPHAPSPPHGQRS